MTVKKIGGGAACGRAVSASARVYRKYRLGVWTRKPLLSAAGVLLYLTFARGGLGRRFFHAFLLAGISCAQDTDARRRDWTS